MFFGTGCDETVQLIAEVMYAKKPYTLIMQSVLIHPTISESIPSPIAKVRTGSKFSSSEVVLANEVDVCIVGAGFAGLAAAYKLKQAGQSVVLWKQGIVSAGVFTPKLSDGTPLNWGGTFIGAGHDRLYALIKEFDCETYPTYTDGQNITIIDGKIKTYSGAIPRINPVTLIDSGVAIDLLNQMARQIPIETPWNAHNANELDSQTIRADQFIVAPSNFACKENTPSADYRDFFL